jgi:hypothetical protein
VGSGELATFVPLDDLRLEIQGSPRTLRHYRAEYGAVMAGRDRPPDLVVSFRRRLAGAPALQGGHKGLRWRIHLSQPSSRPLEATIALDGEPRTFGLSLLQGYVIEPLLALLATASDNVLLPAAAIDVDSHALVLLGRSRSGKSSLTALAAAAAFPVLGDDHVVVRGDGVCSPFPRRLRIYPDIRRTAPGAYAVLRRSDRARLRSLALVRTATRGAVAPPLRVPIDALGLRSSPLPLGRVVVVERRPAPELASVEIDREELVDVAAAILHEQRRALEGLRDAAWLECLGRTRAAETAILRRAFAGCDAATRLVVPDDWEAAHAVTRVAAQLALDV